VLECLPVGGLAEVDFDLITMLIQYIVTSKPPGAILVFVPGWEQIRKLSENITSQQFFKSGWFTHYFGRLHA